jgi:hypothetical protein
MQTVTVQINNNNALKSLEALADKHFVTIIDKTDIDSPALPGKPLSMSEFKSWISRSEKADTVSLSEARSRWVSKRKQLLKLTR